MLLRLFTTLGLAAATADCEAAHAAVQGQALIQMRDSEELQSRDCEKLMVDDCSFKTEPATDFQCDIEHASRLMYTSWVKPRAKVLEVGARYGQTSCTISQVLQKGELFASDADPDVWDILEANLKDHNCSASVVRGPVGKTAIKVWKPPGDSMGGYGERTFDIDDPRGRTVAAHSVKSLNTTFDTLAIDCEGCFTTFFEENPELLTTLTMIIAEIHGEDEEATVQGLIGDGWTEKQRMRDQRVLCKGSCHSYCSESWVLQHALQHWDGDVKAYVPDRSTRPQTP